MISGLITLLVMAVAVVLLRRYRHRLADGREWVRERLLTVARWLIWSPWRIGAVFALVVVAIIIGINIRQAGRPAPPPPPAETRTPWPVTTAGADPNASAGTTDSGPTDTPSPSASASATGVVSSPGKALAGDELGRAWVAAFLTRSAPDSIDWVEAIGPLSTDDLVSTLRAQTTDSLGVDLAGPWRVIKITAYKPPDPAPNTPVRDQHGYVVTIDNGQSTVEKPFVITAYRGADGWQVASAEQPYTSKG